MAKRVYKTKSAAQDARRKGYTVRKRKGGYSLYRVKPSKKSTVKKRKSTSKKRKAPVKRRKTTAKRKSPSKKRKSSKKLYKTKTAAKNARRKGYTVRKRKGGYSLYRVKPAKRKSSSKRKSPSKKRKTSRKRRSTGTRTSSGLALGERNWGEGMIAGIPRWQRSMTSGQATKNYVKGVSRFTGLKASTVSGSKPAKRHRASAKRAGATASLMKKNVGIAKRAKSWSKNYKKAFMKK